MSEETKIKKALAEGAIEFADQSKIAQSQDVLDIILRAVKHPEAWVSDRSCFSDFCLSKKQKLFAIDLIKKETNVDITAVWDLYFGDLVQFISSGGAQ